MATDRISLGATGLALYALLYSGAEVWDATADQFVSLVEGDLADYALPLAEVGTTGEYTLDVPEDLPPLALETPTQPYAVVVRRRVGGSPAWNDPVVGTTTWEWSAYATLAGAAALVDFGNQAFSFFTSELAAIAADAEGAADDAAETLALIGTPAGGTLAADLAANFSLLTLNNGYLVSIDGVTQSIQTTVNNLSGRVPATLNAGRMRSHVEAIEADAVSAASVSAAAVDKIQAGLATAANVTDATSAIIDHGDVAWITADTSGLSTFDPDNDAVRLASDGLDAIDVTAPTGPSTTWAGMLVQLWRRRFRRATIEASGGTGTLKTYDDDGNTVLTTQAISDDGTTQDQGAAT